MITAIVLAGGVGQRSKKDLPKQFYTVFDKPIIIYTLEQFQAHSLVDQIVVVCLAGWQSMMESYADKYEITKLKTVAIGGAIVHDSIHNGLIALEGLENADDPNHIVLIHDGVRPLVTSLMISDCINTCKEKGNAVSSVAYTEQIFWTEDGTTTSKYIRREDVRCVQTPQAYRYSELKKVYEIAYTQRPELLVYYSYTNNLMVDCGQTLHLSLGSSSNIKLTTPEDFDTFRAIIRERNDF